MNHITYISKSTFSLYLQHIDGRNIPSKKKSYFLSDKAISSLDVSEGSA